MGHYDDFYERFENTKKKEEQEKAYNEYLKIRDAYFMKEYGNDESAVEHPKHYNRHPSGVECVEITKHMNFCLGSAIKYIWRADHKHDAIEDLKKAIFCIETEIQRRQNNGETTKK